MRCPSCQSETLTIGEVLFCTSCCALSTVSDPSVSITSAPEYEGFSFPVAQHPERARVARVLDELPEDMPLMVLSARTRDETDAARWYAFGHKGGDEACALVERMEAYHTLHSE